MVTSEMIRSFYRKGFEESVIHRTWPHLWKKHFRIESLGSHFIKLNRFRDRFNFSSLKNQCVRFAPLHLYMSVLNWLMPERVGEKRKAGYAYPIGGEYVVDVDADLHWRPHTHYIGPEGVCGGCRSLARDPNIYGKRISVVNLVLNVRAILKTVKGEEYERLDGSHVELLGYGLGHVVLAANLSRDRLPILY